jgi:hypothetical protein
MSGAHRRDRVSLAVIGGYRVQGKPGQLSGRPEEAASGGGWDPTVPLLHLPGRPDSGRRIAGAVRAAARQREARYRSRRAAREHLALPESEYCWLRRMAARD